MSSFFILSNDQQIWLRSSIGLCCFTASVFFSACLARALHVNINAWNALAIKSSGERRLYHGGEKCKEYRRHSSYARPIFYDILWEERFIGWRIPIAFNGFRIFTVLLCRLAFNRHWECQFWSTERKKGPNLILFCPCKVFIREPTH